MEVKMHTEEKLENLSREELFKVVTETIKQNEKLTEELDKQKKDNNYWFERFSEEQERAYKAEATLALVSKQRDSAIKAVHNLALAVAPAEQPTTQE